MTGRGPWPGRKRLAGFLAAAVVVGWSVVVSGSAVAKDACSPERAAAASSGAFSTVPDTTAFGSGTIAYNRQRPDGSRAGIWVADADGADAGRLAGSGSRPVWSPDGHRIAYEEWPSGEVRVMDADGTNARRLTTGSNPVWSPDGDRIAYEEWDGDGVWVADADGANARRLTTGWKPVWSPEGNRIAYSDGGIWTIDADGGNPRLLAGAGADAAWSPDGRRIVYYESGPDRGVWVADADGGDRRWLVGGTAPVWSPDGKRIAYSDGGELSGIWVMDADGGNRRQLTRGGSSPLWSPDGSHITYLDLRSDEYVFDLWAVDTEQGDRRRLALKGDYPAWSPDGQQHRLLHTGRAGSGDMGGGCGRSPDGRRRFGSGVVTARRQHRLHQIGRRGYRALGDGRRRGRHPAAGSDRGSEPAWSPDGRRIAYAGEGGAVWVAEVRMAVTGQQLTDDWRPNCQLRRSGPGLVTGRRPHHLPPVGCRLRSRGLGRGR